MEIKFIVCEDNTKTMELYQLFFSENQIPNDQIAFFEDGRGAIELLGKLSNKPIFVLTDFNMPFKDGADVLLAAIKAKAPFRIIRSSMQKSSIQEILDLRGITEDFIYLSKFDELQLLKEEVLNYLEIYATD